MQIKRRLTALNEQLDGLLTLLESGNWEQLPEIEAGLLNALNTACTPDCVTERAQTEALLGKLEKAIAACSLRKEQIAPLVDALASKKKPSTDT